MFRKGQDMNKRQLLLIITGIIVLLSAVRSDADTLILKNGREVYGDIIDETDEYIKINMSGDIVKFSRGEIDRINKVTPEEKERFEVEEKKYEIDQSKKGLVIYRGRWMAPEEKADKIWGDSCSISNISAEWSASPGGSSKKSWSPRVMAMVENLSKSFDIESLYLKILILDADKNIVGDSVVEFVGTVPAGYNKPIITYGSGQLTSDTSFAYMDADISRKWRAEVYMGNSEDGPWKKVKSVIVEIPANFVGVAD